MVKSVTPQNSLVKTCPYFFEYFYARNVVKISPKLGGLDIGKYIKTSFLVCNSTARKKLLIQFKIFKILPVL